MINRSHLGFIVTERIGKRAALFLALRLGVQIFFSAFVPSEINFDVFQVCKSARMNLCCQQLIFLFCLSIKGILLASIKTVFIVSGHRLHAWKEPHWKLSHHGDPTGSFRTSSSEVSLESLSLVSGKCNSNFQFLAVTIAWAMLSNEVSVHRYTQLPHPYRSCQHRQRSWIIIHIRTWWIWLESCKMAWWHAPPVLHDMDLPLSNGSALGDSFHSSAAAWFTIVL